MSDYATDLDPLCDLLDEWGVDHFTARELTAHNNPRWDGPRHICPPANKLTHIAHTVRIADVLRTVWGGPVAVTSGYRCDAYNDLVGGSPNSQHKHFRALDLHPTGGSFREFWRMAYGIVEWASRWSDWPTGFGVYVGRSRPFLHVDSFAEDVGHRRRWAFDGGDAVSLDSLI